MGFFIEINDNVEGKRVLGAVNDEIRCAPGEIVTEVLKPHSC